MRIALIHDYIKEYGGAERVLEELHKLFPEAPVYTSIYSPKFLGPHRKDFESMRIRTSFLQYIPFKEKLISVFRLISPFVFAGFDLSKFDVIIVSQTGAYFPNLVYKGKSKLICYTHTPPRYLYGYMTAREWQKDKLMKFFGHIANHFLRMVDFKAAQNIDYFIANSEEVKGRIEKFYRREAVVIYPPVELNPKSEIRNPKKIINHKSSIINRPYYLTGGRLARAKGIDIIVEAFLKNGKPLKIFGRGFAGFEDDLKSKILNLKSKIEFVGEVTDEEKLELMRGAKAYIFASFDEDFGITPVESMAVGTPVIAYRSGGVKETVVEGKTGLFFDENRPDAINSAVRIFEHSKIDSDECRKRANRFSREIFDKKILDFIKRSK